MIRCVIEDGNMWFPLVDITTSLKDAKGKIPVSLSSWLVRNLPNGSVRKVHFGRNVVNRAGKLVAVNSDNVKYVNMYENYVRSGKDFRAKWSDLPDEPSFNIDIKYELSWKHCYKWSKVEHAKNTKLTDKALAEMRKIYDMVLSKVPKPEEISYKEAKILVGLSK